MKSIYQLRIELNGSDPHIRRRIQVPDDIFFYDLHDVLQMVMGWEDQQEHEFKINNVRIFDFGLSFDDGKNPEIRDSHFTTLDEMMNLVGTQLTYIYDFSDYWEHSITLEKLLPKGDTEHHYRCIDGYGACPPENCGGIESYKKFLKIMADKDHPEHQSMKEWAEGEWDPYHFDANEVDDMLKDYGEEWEMIFNEIHEQFDLSAMEDISEEEEAWPELANDENESPEIKQFSNKDSSSNTETDKLDPCPCGSGRQFKDCCMELL